MTDLSPSRGRRQPLQLETQNLDGTDSPPYVPPYPDRFETPPSTLKRVALARRSFLDIWSTADFSQRIAWVKVLTRDVAFVNAPDLVKQVFQDNHPLLQRKSPQMRHALELLLGDGLFVSDSEVWAARRKIVAPIIHGSRVPDFAPVMIQVIEECRDRWEAMGEGAEIDASAEFAWLTSEVICRAIFGQTLGEAYAGEIVLGFAEYQRRIDQLDLASLMGLPEWFPRFRGFGVHKSARRIRTVLDRIIDRFEAERTPDDTTVIAALLDARDEAGAPLSREVIRNEAAVIFMAGYETTANLLSWAWFILSQDPVSRRRLEDELDRVVGDRATTYDDVANLPYTRAVVSETLRLYPPVPILAREAIGEVKIGPRVFPKGSLFMVVAWLLHRNPTLWPDADGFRPERFLEPDDRSRIKKPNKYAYVPFATGPRICAGMVFGEAEAILALAVLAQRFRPELKPGTQVKPHCRLTLRPGDSLPMILRKR
ncbi:MAG: cytochrome P450 [Maritimibacter sp.]|nr:cytochrome P450 [Maritimibacter sp.]